MFGSLSHHVRVWLHTHALCLVTNAGEQIVGVLALNRGVTADRSRVNCDTLQQDLSLDCDGDLHVVLAFAE